jgi:PAS domain S-box-containing protein
MIDFDQAELARALFAESGDALFLLDPETDQLVEVNPVAERLTGFPRAELLTFAATYLFRFDAPGGMQRLKAAFAKTMAFHGQDGFVMRARDGSWVAVNLTVSRLHVEPKPLGLIIARDDRERRGALAQARRVESELRTVLSSAPAALWSAERAPGPDVFAGWQFRYVSPLLAQIAGRAPNFLDHPFKWAEVVHPLDRDAYRTALRRLLTHGPDPEQLYRVQAADGGVRWVRDRLQLVRDVSGRPVRLDGCVTDVTEQRRAEEAVRQSEERFRALVEKSRDGIFLLDEHGAILYATPAAKHVLGYEPRELAGTDALALVHAGDVASVRKRLADAVRRPGEDVLITFRAVAADGTVRVIEANAVNRLADPSVRAVVANYRDVTERDRAARELADKHALLDGLFSSVPDVLVYKDRAGLFLGGNPAFEALCGGPVAGVVGRHCADLFNDEWAVRVREAEDHVFASGETSRGKEWVTYPDGRKALLDFAIAPLKGDDGLPTGLIILGRDVTEQDRLEEELRQAHKLEALGRLAGGIAHDFNNLLTVVMGNLELVRSGAAVGAEADEMLAATERAAKQAADLTKQMLGFARRQPLRATAVDLNALVRDSVALLRRTIDPRIAIRFVPGAGLPAVAADPVQVQQIVMNLCLNARDAMPNGGALTLETSASADKPAADGRACVRLAVSDTGVGMTDEVKAKIFDPFFTTKGVGQGTGLGLAVVYGVAKAHGGSVEVTSAPGAGSRFDVYLPCATDAIEPAEREPQFVARGSSSGDGDLVLLADDDDAVRELARAALEMAGYRVLVARDGAEAVEVFRANLERVRLVILDAGMPRMSGRQAFEAIRALAPALPVLFASGYPNAAGSVPGARYLNKPYTPSELTAAVQSALCVPETCGNTHPSSSRGNSPL